MVGQRWSQTSSCQTMATKSTPSLSVQVETRGSSPPAASERDGFSNTNPQPPAHPFGGRGFRVWCVPSSADLASFQTFRAPPREGRRAFAENRPLGENPCEIARTDGHCADCRFGAKWVCGKLDLVSKLQTRRTIMKRNITRATLVILSIATMWPAMAVPVMAQRFPGIGTVMTYNVNEGTDFLQAVGAQNEQQFLLDVGQILTQVQGTNPPERMQAVARQILAVGPELLSLQEVDQWYTGTFNPNAGTCGTMTLEYDMVQELLSALANQGGHYEVAVQVAQNSFPPVPGLIPPANYFCVALTDYNIILARTDLPSWVFQWSNPQSGQFVNELVFQTPVGSLPYPRACASVDAQFFGHSLLYINTHLESFDPNIRELQGGELRAGPANTSLPLIIVMDSNAQAFPLPQDPTYVDFRAV